MRSTDFTYAHEENPTDARNPIYSCMSAVTQTGYQRSPEGGYSSKSIPPLEFSYTEAKVDNTVHEVASESIENLPIGLDNSSYQWLDLDGEGIAGILSEQADGWFYKRNLSPLPIIENNTEPIKARFTPLELVATSPFFPSPPGTPSSWTWPVTVSPISLPSKARLPAFSSVPDQANWDTFRSFRSWPNLDTRNPNLKFIDLDGDGHTDILISEDEVFRWHPSLAEEGFGQAERVHKPDDEEKGPALIFADGSQSIHLADMSGDGLSDIVRIRNGEVCYWPNLGYGRFGAKVTMDNSPLFDAPRLCSIRTESIWRISTVRAPRTSSISAAKAFASTSTSRAIAGAAQENSDVFPRNDDLDLDQRVVDLLGNGTPAWSGHRLCRRCRTPLRYIDLMGGKKPHLLVNICQQSRQRRQRHLICGVDQVLPERPRGRQSLGHAAAFSGPCRRTCRNLRLDQPQPASSPATTIITAISMALSVSSEALAGSSKSTPRRD